MKEYFDMNEKLDLQQLYEFNAEKRLFDSIKPNEYSAQIDATAKHKNREFAVEIKHRLIPVNKYKTIMIEDYKYLELMLEYQFTGREPLYINFCNDAVVIFNLNKLKNKPKLKILDIESKGYDKTQKLERRYYLDINDAVIYDWTWKTMQQYS